MRPADIHRRAYGRIADRLRRHPVLLLVAMAVLGMAIASAVHFNGAASRATSTAPGGPMARTLPAEGVFESCSLDTEMPTCLGRLHAIHQGGMQVVVITAWAGSLDSLRAYAAAAQSLGMSVMWELSDPSWWRDPLTSTGAAGQFPAFATGCGCDQNGRLLAYTIRWLGGLPGTYGYYAADDCVLSAGDKAGVASYVSQIKAQDPVHTVMIGAYGQQQRDAYQAMADVIGAELYPVRTGSLMPVSANQSAWDSVTGWVRQTQHAADAAGKQSAFILQAFTWGDNLSDGQAIEVCTAADTQQSCYDKLAYPSPGDQLQMRNEVLLNAHPKLILWWSFPGTYGQAGSDTYSIYPTGAEAAARWSGLGAAAEAPLPASQVTQAPATGSQSGGPAKAPKLGSPPAGRPFNAISLGRSQRGTTVEGSVRLSDATTGRTLEIDLRATARSLGRSGLGTVRVGRLIRTGVRPGTARFGVALDAAAKRAQRASGGLSIAVVLSVQVSGRPAVSVSRSVRLISSAASTGHRVEA